MVEKSIKKNYVYNLVYQIVLLIAPFVTTPYVSRVLMPEGVGLYSYAYSMVSYFTLVAILGTTTFGQRAISYVQNDKEERSRAFWEVFILRTITSIVTLLLYCGYVVLLGGENKLIFFILALNILNVIFDISWFFQGVEEFETIAIRSVILKILNVVSIFLFVKNADDLPIYAILMMGFTALGSMVLWISLPKYLCKVKNIRPFKDIKTVFELFIPTVAVQVYTILDKSMIGWFTDGYAENGYYEQSEKIVKMTLTIVTSLGTVMTPRISRVYKEGDIEKVKDYIYKSYRFVWMMAIPIMFGLIAISRILVPIFLGDGYDKCVILITIFSALVIFIGLSNVTGTQYLVPVGRQNILTLTVVAGAIVNFVLNLILIRYYAALGACIASIIAEFVVTAVGFIYIKKTKQYKLTPVFSSSIKYWIAGIAMFAILFILQHFMPIKIWSLIVLILSGVAIYFLMLLILKDKFFIDAVRKILGRVKSKLISRSNNNKDNNKNMDLNKQYDYLVVGAGLFGAVFAHEAKKCGKKVLVIDKRPHIAGNIYTEEIEGINVHRYGAHIFHTNDKQVWQFITQFAEFNRYTNSPVANYKGELYSLPFNMYTFNKMWGVVTPDEAAAKIEEQKRSAGIKEPENLEEQAISLVGTDVYEKLVKSYTQKQWGRPCNELPSFIIKRLPVRFTFDNNYFNALYQGIPMGGYTAMVEKMLEGVEVKLNCDYFADRDNLNKSADKIIFTGAIDAYFNYKLGALEYRSVRFETEVLDKANFQGNAVVNYTDAETPFTRIIEHKFFEFGAQPKTVISREYSSEWKVGDEPYYPVNDEKNGALYAEYKKLAESEDKVIFGGRLGEYKYYDMDKVIESALAMCRRLGF